MAGPLLALAPYLIAAAGSIGTQVAANRANRNMAKMAYKHDVDMWNKQNEYNSPQAQQERIREAGLNPALMYGQGSTGNATQLPQYQAPRQQYEFTPEMNPLGMMSQYLDLKKKGTDISLTEQQVQLTALNAVLTDATTVKIAGESRIKNLEADMLASTYDSTVQARIANNLYDIAKSQVEQWRARMVNKYNVRPEDAVWLRGIITVLELFNFDKQKLQSLIQGL